MPLYEVLLHANGRSEVRLTDQPLGLGETVKILGHEWIVKGEANPVNPAASTRFVLIERFANRNAKAN